MKALESKDELRARIRAARKAIPAAEKLGGEQAIAERLLSLPAVKRAHVIGVYHAAGSEASLAPTIRVLRTVGQRPVIAYPLVISKEAMIFARFDADEDLGVLDNPKKLHSEVDPARIVEPEDIDVLLVPGIAFDANGRRLGQGGGYYDRYLPLLRGDTVTIGIAFDEQIVAEVPHDTHDRRVGYIATPTRLLTVI